MFGELSGTDRTLAASAPDLSEAAATLGVTVEELAAALGGPPPDFEAAAETLGISVEELVAVLPGAPGAG